MTSPERVVASHTFGSVLRGFDFDGLSVEEVVMPRGLVVPEHGHEGGQIYFVLEGTYVETIRGRSHLLPAGAAWFRPPAEGHANRVDGDEEVLTLIATFDRSRLASLERRAWSPRGLQSLVLDEVRTEIVREIRRGDAVSSMALQGWTLLLLSRTARLLCGGENGAPEWLGEALRFIERSYRQPLTLSAVAAHVAVHPATLATAFRRFHQMSVGQCIRELRLRYARNELLESRRPLKDIALDAGFYDQAHFGKVFKHRFGVSPAALRSCAAPRRRG
jgi:AraC family transcriptional regulator